MRIPGERYAAGSRELAAPRVHLLGEVKIRERYQHSTHRYQRTTDTLPPIELRLFIGPGCKWRPVCEVNLDIHVRVRQCW
jgi:hypothetical protein